MNESDFPALYRSADDLALRSQRHFFSALRAHLLTLILAAVASTVAIEHWSIAVTQLLCLLSALSCSVYLFARRPDRLWYAGRAVAESIKTLTWRYVSRAEPFDQDDKASRIEFGRKLKAVVDQNREVGGSLTAFLAEPQISELMEHQRAQSLDVRRSLYEAGRITNQMTWYASKATLNRRRSIQYFWTLIAVNGAAVIFAILRVANPEQSNWPTDVMVAAAASLLSWMQAKRYSELAASYSLAAHEIGLIKAQVSLQETEENFSQFVGDAENAFSREHTQWVARKDA